MKMTDSTAQRFTFTRRKSASNKTPRLINRNLVFNLVRSRQEISRADVARVSGLQRSTVSLIVEELIASGWVVEGPSARRARGRRPTALHVSDRRAVIALDIHPAQTTVAVADLGGRILAHSLVDLPADPQKVAASIVAAIKKIMAANADRSFDGVGICFPGRLDRNLEKLVFAPNLHWPAQSIRARIEKATGLRVEMDNVANACALAEVWFGDSDGMHDLVVVNVSEGIGTGIFANGRLLRGENGMAGEFGHVQLEPNGLPCGCGSRGCWETLASNRAGLRYYCELAGPRLAHRQQPPTDSPIPFEALLRLAQAGNPPAVQALEKMAVALGRGMKMIASVLSPSEIVVVGDITTSWHMVGPIVEAQMRDPVGDHARVSPLARAPRIRPAHEGNTARLRSAVALVMNESSLTFP